MVGWDFHRRNKTKPPFRALGRSENRQLFSYLSFYYRIKSLGLVVKSEHEAVGRLVPVKTRFIIWICSEWVHQKPFYNCWQDGENVEQDSRMSVKKTKEIFQANTFFWFSCIFTKLTDIKTSEFCTNNFPLKMAGISPLSYLFCIFFFSQFCLFIFFTVELTFLIERLSLCLTQSCTCHTGWIYKPYVPSCSFSSCFFSLPLCFVGELLALEKKFRRSLFRNAQTMQF